MSRRIKTIIILISGAVVSVILALVVVAVIVTSDSEFVLTPQCDTEHTIGVWTRYEGYLRMTEEEYQEYCVNE